MTEISTHLNTRKKRSLIIDSKYLNADSSSPIAEFKYEFIFDGITVIYHYGKKNISEVIYEKLWIDDELMIEWRNGAATAAIINLEGTATLDRHLSNNVLSALVYTKNNGNLLDVPSNKAFLALFQFVEKMFYIKTINQASEYVGSIPADFSGIMEQIVYSNDSVKKFEHFLNELGITCQLDVFNGLKSKQLVFVHKNRHIDFLDAASSGTLSLTNLYCWLERMDDMSVSFAYIDEFDAFYHQKLAKTIAQRISNTRCQTILSTHNTGIMSNDLLRPDCYFELKSEKIKPLYALSDRELRKAHNLEKMYRAGAFDE